MIILRDLFCCTYMGSHPLFDAFWPRGSKMSGPWVSVSKETLWLCSVSLSYVMLCRLGRIHCPLFCLDVRSLWDLPLQQLDSYHFLFSTCFCPDTLFAAQFLCSEAGTPWLLLSRYVLSLRAFWTRILPSLSHSTLLHSATFVLCRRVLRMTSHGVSPETVCEAMSTEETSQPPCLVSNLQVSLLQKFLLIQHLWRWCDIAFFQSFSLDLT